MSKNTAFWVMVVGAGASIYDLMTTEAGMTGGALYGVGKPLEKARIEAYKTAAGKQYYASATDAMAVVGAYFYFR